MHIIDNYLPIDSFNFLKKNTIGNFRFDLYKKESVSGIDTNEGWYFSHTFSEIFNDGKTNLSPDFSILQPILNKIFPQKLIRAKLNLYPSTGSIIKHNFHIDYPYPHQGMILSLNTCNGKTIIKNRPFNIGIKSIANRALFFDPSEYHRSTTCTNAYYRSNIIFNYL